MKAIIITIGDEILNGDTVDSNSAFIGQALAEIGIKVTERISVGDVKKDILLSFDRAFVDGDLIITTGGLGPTNDDLTKECFAEYFNTTLVENKSLRDKIEGYYKSRGRGVEEVSEKMTHVPKSATILPNNFGVAPGMWKAKGKKAIVALPGVPFEMRGLIREQVIPKIEKEFELDFIKNHYFMTAGKGETTLANRLVDIESNLPKEFSISYLPSFANVKVRLSVNGLIKNKKELLQQMSKIVPQIKAKLLPELYSEEKNESLVHAIARLCNENHYTIATAESCTGGNIAHKITSVPGSSAYYLGSIIAYDNEVKKNMLGVKQSTLEKKGAVSEEVVKEMVQGTLINLKTDYAVATSGIAGPSGGSDVKPVGLLCVAVGNKNGVITKSITFTKNREKNIELFTMTALNMLFKQLQKDVNK